VHFVIHLRLGRCYLTTPWRNLSTARKSLGATSNIVFSSKDVRIFSYQAEFRDRDREQELGRLTSLSSASRVPSDSGWERNHGYNHSRHEQH